VGRHIAVDAGHVEEATAVYGFLVSLSSHTHEPEIVIERAKSCNCCRSRPRGRRPGYRKPLSLLHDAMPAFRSTEISQYGNTTWACRMMHSWHGSTCFHRHPIWIVS